MGKKANKRTVRNVQKEKQLSTSSPKNVPEKVIPSTVVDGVPVVKEARVCPHLQTGINLEKITAKITNFESLTCDDCREVVVDKRASKVKGKSKKKGGNSTSESKSIWVCLECGHFTCGGLGFPTTPNTHATRHAKQKHHPLAVQFANPKLRWCFSCNTLIPVQTSENGESKDVLCDVIKLLKTRPSSENSVDVEDVWFGSGSVLNDIKSVNTSSSSEHSGGYKVKGLLNLGNTCFFNSILQNLLAMNKLRDHFLRLEKPDGTLTVTLKKLFVESISSTSAKHVVNPRPLFNSVCATASQFKGYQQQDSHELLRFLLDGLCNEESGIQNSVPKQNPTFVDTMFGGQTSSSVSCLECGHTSIVYEPYLDLSLPLPTKKSPSKKIPTVSRSKMIKAPLVRRGKYGRRNINVTGTSSVVSDSPQSSQTEENVTEKISEITIKESGISSDSLALVSPLVRNGKFERRINNVTGSSSVVSDSSHTENHVTEKISEITIKESGISSDNLAVVCYVEPNSNTNPTVDSFNSPLEYLGPTIVSSDHSAVACNSDDVVAELACNGDDVVGELACNGDGAVGELACNGDDVVAELTCNDDDVVACNGDDVVVGLACNGDDVVAEVACNGDDVMAELACNGDDVVAELAYTGGDDVVAELADGSWLDYLSSSNDHNEGDDVVAELAGGSWLDYLSSSNDYNPVSQNNDSLEVQIAGNSNDVLWEDEPLLQAQDSEIILLPYEKLTPTTNGYEQDALDIDGFGGLFDEPEVVSKPIVGPLSNGFDSDSDSDEVDSSDYPLSVEKCLSFFTTSEILTKSEHAWHCEKCSKSLLEQKKTLQNKLREPVSNGVENGILSTSSDSTIEHTVSNGLHNEKSVVNGDQSSDTVSNEESSTVQDTDSCHVNETSDKCEDVKVHKNGLNGVEEDEVDSSNVKMIRDASKRILIDKVPPILTIHLKRLSQDARGRLSKLNGHVDFQDVIDLEPYMNPSCKEKEVYKYRLIGVVEHIGSMRGGHYVAYVRGGAKGNTDDCLWYHASDAHVRKVSFEEVLRCEAYILFYEQM